MSLTSKFIKLAVAKKAFNWLRNRRTSQRRPGAPNRNTGASRAPGRVGR